MAGRRTFSLLCIAFFLFSFGNSAFNLLPKHFELSGFAPRTIGFIMGAAPIGGLVLLPVLIAAIDRYRLRVLIATAILLQVLVSALYLVSVTPNALYALPRFLQGIVTTVAMVGFNAAVSRGTVDRQRLHRFTVFGMMGPLGSLSGIGLGEPIYDAYGLMILYLLAAIAFAVALTIVVSMTGCFPENRPTKNTDSVNVRERKPFFQILTREVPHSVAFSILILGVAMGTVVTFIPSAVMTAGMTQIRPFFVAYPIAIITVRVAMTGVLKRVPNHILVALPLFGLPATLFAIPLVSSASDLAIAGALYGMSHGILSPILISTFLSRARKTHHGGMSALFQFLFNIGTFAAANIGGLLAEIHVHWAFWFAGILSLVGTLWGLFGIHKLGLRQA